LRSQEATRAGQGGAEEAQAGSGDWSLGEARAQKEERGKFLVAAEELLRIRTEEKAAGRREDGLSAWKQVMSKHGNCTDRCHGSYAPSTALLRLTCRVPPWEQRVLAIRASAEHEQARLSARQVREHSSAVERCGPHVAVSLVMLRSLTAAHRAAGDDEDVGRAAGGAGAGADGGGAC